MILFCDTSALIKLYLVEEYSAQLTEQLREAEAVVVCRIAWAEAHAALSRRVREAPGNDVLIEQAKSALSKDWPSFVIMEIDQALVERAGEFADAFALRAYDSIQLAAASVAANISQTELFFACFDTRLNKAAKLLGMRSF